MKKLCLILSLFFTLPLISKAAGTAKDTIMFDALVDRTSSATITKGGISITSLTNIGNPGADFDAYTKSYGLHYKITSGATVYFTSFVGNIRKVIITYSQDSSVPSIMGKSSGNVSNNSVWTGNIDNFNFYYSPAAYISSITVIYDIINESTLDISSAEYATFWTNNRYLMPKGITGYALEISGNKIVFGKKYETDSIVPSNTPLLIHGNEGTYTYYHASNGGTAAGTNLLQRSTGVEISDANTYYYKLSYRSSTDRTLGFYWDSDDGHSINISNGKAFLAVPQAIAGNAKGFDITSITNGINQLTTNKNIMPAIGEIVYDPSGKAHPYSTSLQRGIYFIKGVGKIAIK